MLNDLRSCLLRGDLIPLLLNNAPAFTLAPRCHLGGSASDLTHHHDGILASGTLVFDLVGGLGEANFLARTVLHARLLVQ